MAVTPSMVAVDLALSWQTEHGSGQPLVIARTFKGENLMPLTTTFML